MFNYLMRKEFEKEMNKTREEIKNLRKEIDLLKKWKDEFVDNGNPVTSQTTVCGKRVIY